MASRAMMQWNTLLRLRRENAAARMVPGLGARNVPYAREYGAQPLAAQIGRDSWQEEGADIMLAKLNRQLDELESRVDVEEAATRQLRAATRTSAAGMAGRQTLADRLKARGFGIKRDGIELGPVEIGRAGIGMNAGFMRGVGGTAFRASVALHVVGGGLSAYANVQDKVNAIKQQGGTNSEVARAIGGSVAGGATRTFASLTGVESLARGLIRIGGMDEADTNRIVEDFYDKLFTTREELQRRKDARAQQLQAMHAEIDKAAGEAWKKINTTFPRTFTIRRADLRAYREEMRDVNIGLLNARRDALKNQAKREQDARIAAGN